MRGVEEALAERVAEYDVDALRERYLELDEFLHLEKFLPDEVLDACLIELDRLTPHTHRNYIPRHKKGGSVGFDKVAELAPTISHLYQSAAFMGFIRSVVDAPIEPCPTRDLHRCALYCYTRAGDHIGYHYDNSYYLDRRYTVLIGLRDRSTSRLSCKLRTRQAGAEQVELEIETRPGALVLFNGDKVLHSITPLGEGEERFVITMQYVTDSGMRPLLRFVSDMKDAIAYFGFRRVFAGGR
jgi:hypothetical protein